MCTFRLCWLFELGYFYWNKAREEHSYFTSYPCVSPLEAVPLTYHDIEAGKLPCNGSEVDFEQNCTKYTYKDDYNQDNNNDNIWEKSTTTTDQPRDDPTTVSAFYAETTRISQMSKNITISPDREKTGNNYIRRDTNKLPDGFWILVGMSIMVLPVLVVVILFQKYLAPCFKSLPKLTSEDNTIYHDKLTIRGVIYHAYSVHEHFTQ